jgi:hypothetical protein
MSLQLYASAALSGLPPLNRLIRCEHRCAAARSGPADIAVEPGDQAIAPETDNEPIADKFSF